MGLKKTLLFGEESEEEFDEKWWYIIDSILNQTFEGISKDWRKIGMIVEETKFV